MDTRKDGSVLAVLAAYQNNLVSSGNDDVMSGSMSPDTKVLKILLWTGES